MKHHTNRSSKGDRRSHQPQASSRTCSGWRRKLIPDRPSTFISSPRRGMALIQMVVTITVLAAASGLGLKIFATLLRAERRALQQTARLVAMGHLTRQFRSDAHQSNDCKIEVNPKTKLCQFELDTDRVIEYAICEQGLIRSVRVPGKGPVQDLYRVGPVSCRCEKVEGYSNLLALVVTAQADPLALDTSDVPGGKDKGHSSRESPVPGKRIIRIETRFGPP